jgi:hypothetical protein
VSIGSGLLIGLLTWPVVVVQKVINRVATILDWKPTPSLQAQPAQPYQAPTRSDPGMFTDTNQGRVMIR